MMFRSCLGPRTLRCDGRSWIGVSRPRRCTAESRCLSRASRPARVAVAPGGSASAGRRYSSSGSGTRSAAMTGSQSGISAANEAMTSDRLTDPEVRRRQQREPLARPIQRTRQERKIEGIVFGVDDILDQKDAKVAKTVDDGESCVRLGHHMPARNQTAVVRDRERVAAQPLRFVLVVERYYRE